MLPAGVTALLPGLDVTTVKAACFTGLQNGVVVARAGLGILRSLWVQASGFSAPSSGARTHLTTRVPSPSMGISACGKPQAGAIACGQRAANRHPARESTSAALGEGLSGARNGTPISGTLRRSAAV